MKKNDLPEIQIIGPFVTENSLAKVNRELAISLSTSARDYRVSLWVDEANAYRFPGRSDFRRYPELQDLFVKDKHKSKVAIINLFPKSFPHSFGLGKIEADIKIVYLAWEESGFPSKIVEEFNRELNGVMVTSAHVLQVLRNAGVTVPIVNVSEGLNQNLAKSEKYSLKTRKSFKFLHVSSGLPRKGIDILIKAFTEEFEKNEDVSLIIKTFHNEANCVPALLENLNKNNSPEIEVIYDSELTEGQMAYLYEEADAVVIPSRAEGFGLPVAEAMLKKVPVITTGYSGQMDFADDENAWLLDYEIKKAESQLGLVNSYWAEPDVQQLKKVMRYLFENRDNPEISAKIEKAFLTARSLTWEKTADKVFAFVYYVSEVVSLKEKKMAIITTYNSKCGIAEYSRDLYSNIEGGFHEVRYFANSDADLVFKDSNNIERTWEYSEKNFDKTLESIKRYNADIVHIQYNPPFYSMESLKLLLIKLKEQGRRVLLTLHSIPDVDISYYSSVLNSIDLIMVHSDEDFSKLKEAGVKNIQLFVHGIKQFADEDKKRLRKKLGINSDPIIASHGLIHEKKGLLEILVSLNRLVKVYPNILFLSVNALNYENSTSQSVLKQMQKLVDKYSLHKNVIFITDFIEKQEIVKILHLADLLVLPYDHLEEGASGAVRYCLASERPVIVSESPIFRDLTDAVFRIPNNNPDTITSAVKQLLEDRELYNKQIKSGSKFVGRNSWESQSRLYLQLIAK